MIFVADTALDKMFDALEVSTVSKEELAQLKANVGAELRRYHEVGAAIDEGMKRGLTAHGLCEAKHLGNTTLDLRPPGKKGLETLRA